MNLLLALIVALIILALPAWPYAATWGYYPSGVFALVLIVLVVLLFTRRRV